MPSSKTVVVLALTPLLLALAGCGSQYQDKVVGTWEMTVPARARFTLEKDGTGSLTDMRGATKSLKWRINKGDNLIFTIDGVEKGGVIKSCDGDTMVLYDGKSDLTMTFTRAK